MRFRNTALLAITLIAGIILIQSFYYYSAKKATSKSRVYLKGFNTRAALCVAVFSKADSEMSIPALKGWGNYKWKISNASDSVQFYFNQGISMYYAFHDIESIASFTKATRLGPNCAMAWYGKALALGPNINYPTGYRPPSDAYQAAMKSLQLSDQCTDLEKDLISAIKQRYSADTTTDVTRLKAAYAQAMKVVYEKHRSNAEVVTLYGDALLLLHPWDLYEHDFTPKPWTSQIRALFEQALGLSPKHPGANHYYIHTMEASATPELALKSAHILDTLMPGVSHITHMPSHIYIRTGNYQQGIINNVAAVKAYHDYLKQYAPVVNEFPLYEAHNTHMRVNCAQMAGNYKTAIEAAIEVQTALPADYFKLKGDMANFVQYVYMQPILTYLRFGKWDQILKTNIADSLAYASSLTYFAKGVAYIRQGNPASAKTELDRLDKRMLDKSLKEAEIFSSAYESCMVAKLVLQGLIAEQKKDYAAAIDYLQKAVKAEDHLVYNEPRDWPIPTRQYLGNVLIVSGKYDQAIAVLKQDLVNNPKNGWSLTGLQLAYTRTNNSTELQKVNAELKDAFSIRDLDIKRPVF